MTCRTMFECELQLDALCIGASDPNCYWMYIAAEQTFQTAKLPHWCITLGRFSNPSAAGDVGDVS